MPWTKERQSEIDALVSSENTEALCKYVTLNQSAKDYLNLALYYQACSSETYKESDLKLAKMLLTAGANPNYIHDNDNSEGYKSLLEVAAEYAKDWLVEILLKHGAKTDLFVGCKPPLVIPSIARDDERGGELLPCISWIPRINRGKSASGYQRLTAPS